MVHWLGWISRHPGEFLTILGAWVGAIAAFLTAAAALKSSRAALSGSGQNTKQIEILQKTYNQTFLREPYKKALQAFGNTMKNFQDWLYMLENMKVTNTFDPSLISHESLIRDRDIVTDFATELEISPNPELDGALRNFALQISKTLDQFDELYSEYWKTGKITINQEKLNELIPKMKSEVEQLGEYHKVLRELLTIKIREFS